MSGLPPGLRALAPLALGLAMACAHAGAYDETRDFPQLEKQVDNMSEMPPDSARVDIDDARLEATFAAVTPETVRVRYRLHNSGDAALAVFDRGDRHAVLAKRQLAGAVGAPTFEEAGGGDVVLRHVARPLAGGLTGPTVPPTPLALRLAPGASVEGEFSFPIPASSPPKRVRWCLGVAPFDDAGFFSPETAEAGEIWQADDNAFARQQLLCTPWFVMAAGRFEER